MSEAKRLAAEKAIEYVEDGMIVGVGTGSTVAYFIDALGRIQHRIKGAVSSSEQSTARLKQLGIDVLELNHTGSLSLYVDGADECDPGKCLIKGGGAALTREKIIAEASERFICIVDPSKQVPVLGRFPLPVEVIPMARSLVARQIRDLARGRGDRQRQPDPGHPPPADHRSGKARARAQPAARRGLRGPVRAPPRRRGDRRRRTAGGALIPCRACAARPA